MATTRMVFNLVANDQASSAFDKLARNVELSNAAIARHNAQVAGSSRALDDNSRSVDRNNNSLARLSGTLTTTTHGFGLLVTSAVAFAPAIEAAAAVATAGIIGLGGIITSTGAALGVFGLTAKAQFTGLSEGYKNIQKLKEQAAAAPAGSKQQEAAYAALAKAQKDYTATFGPAAAGMNNLQTAWANWKKATSGQTNEILAKGLNLLAAALPKLRPLFDTGAAAADRFLNAVQGWVKSGGLDRAVKMLNDMAKQVFPFVETAMRNLAAIAGDLAPLFFDLGIKVAAGFASMTTAMAKWAGGKGVDAMNSFMAYITANGPRVWALLKALADAAISIVTALAPLAPVSLAIATGLAQLIAAAPPGVIQAAAVAFVAYSLGVKAVALWAPIAAVGSRALSVALWLVNTALFANPIMALITVIVAAVAALGGAIYLTIKYHQDLWGIIQTVWRGFLTVVQTVWNAIRPVLSALWTAMGGQQIIAAWQSVVSFFQGTIGAIIGTFNSLKAFITGSFDTWWAANGEAIKAIWNAVWTSVANVVRGVWAVIQPIIQVGMTIIRGAIQTGMTIVQAAWSAAWSVISTVVQVAWGVIQAIFRAGMAVITAVWNFGWAVLVNVLKVMWATIQAVIKIAWDVVVGIFTIAINLLTGRWGAAWNALRAMCEQVLNALKAFFGTWWSATEAIFSAALTFLQSILSAAWNAIRNTASAVWGGIRSFFTGWWNGLRSDFNSSVEWIKSVLANAWASISSTASSAWNGIKNAIRVVWEGIKDVVRAPIKWVADNIWNRFAGIVNTFTNFVGLGKPIPTLSLATGGIVPQIIPGPGDRQPALLEAGETVVSRKHSAILAPAFAAAGVPGYQFGGIVGDIARVITGGGVAVAGADNLTELAGKLIAGSLKATAQPLISALTSALTKMPGLGTGWGKAIAEVPKKAFAAFLNWLGDQDAKAAAAAAAAAASAGTMVANVGSGVERWRGIVLQALALNGVSASLANNVLYQIQTESGGNPNAINLTDINAQRGDPSKGLLQVIGATFRAYHVAGTSSNIYDPLANVAAGINYAKHVYGPTLMRGGMGIGSGHGYRYGAWDVPVTGPATVHKGEMILPSEIAASIRSALKGGGGQPDRIERLLTQLIHVSAAQGEQFARALDGTARRARAY